MKGADVLRVLVELTARDASDRALSPAAHPGTIARTLGERDGRAVAAPLQRLVEAGMAEQGRKSRRLASGRIKEYRGASSTVYSPTERGREIDRLVAAATSARGGSFAPKSTLGLTTCELLALR